MFFNASDLFLHRNSPLIFSESSPFITKTLPSFNEKNELTMIIK